MLAIAYFILPEVVQVIKVFDTSHHTVHLHEDHLALRHRALLRCHRDILPLVDSYGL